MPTNYQKPDRRTESTPPGGWTPKTILDATRATAAKIHARTEQIECEKSRPCYEPASKPQ